MAEIDRMTRLPLPDDGSGVFAPPIAARIRVFTAGRDKTDGDSTRMNRVGLPEPSSSFFGSRSRAPWMKHNPTPLAPAAIEKMLSEGRSVAEYPITKKL